MFWYLPFDDVGCPCIHTFTLTFLRLIAAKNITPPWRNYGPVYNANLLHITWRWMSSVNFLLIGNLSSWFIRRKEKHKYIYIYQTNKRWQLKYHTPKIYTVVFKKMRYEKMFFLISMCILYNRHRHSDPVRKWRKKSFWHNYYCNNRTVTPEY